MSPIQFYKYKTTNQPKGGAQQEKHSTAKHTDTTILTCKKSTESSNTKIPNTKTIIQHRTAISTTVSAITSVTNTSHKQTLKTAVTQHQSTHKHVITRSNSVTITKPS
ncbi:hypothetical protein MtrunA17_Chr1g0164441 [Medicago truncatula]|uniref:Uncharacterized protein n=1 Tax=Medicago truncatula TaxID=3880 RepID=A0A396JNR0_MEDTR|nr:hypothetical protein MtrunA17_Chr1g0164441 [Medicago truncatula]